MKRLLELVAFAGFAALLAPSTFALTPCPYGGPAEGFGWPAQDQAHAGDWVGVSGKVSWTFQLYNSGPEGMIQLQNNQQGFALVGSCYLLSGNKVTIPFYGNNMQFDGAFSPDGRVLMGKWTNGANFPTLFVKK